MEDLLSRMKNQIKERRGKKGNEEKVKLFTAT
jgi:hypothetical protein